jgi:hypothetical protein
MRRSWYDPAAAASVRVVSEPEESGAVARRGRRDLAPVGLGECLLYPLTDGPGIGLLVFFPPVLWILSLPVFDVIAMLQPFTKGDWALGLMVLPIFLPLLFSFAMTLGYVLLFLGQTLVASALGERDHPRWPEWHPHEISEGLGRWLWALLFGFALGGFPLVVYWKSCGDIDWLDRVVFADLVILGAGYAQMALAASLLHDNIVAANPYTVLTSIWRTGWDYVQPCIVAGVAIMLAAGAFWAVLYRMPTMKVAAVALWAFWVFALYEAMVVARMIGLTYYTHANDLAWFRRRPKWGTPARFGRIYSKS